MIRFLASMFALLFVFPSASALAAEKQPNILLILADDLGSEALGSYGGLSYETPHLDRFAKRSVRFTRAYTSPVCTPSRMSLYTGTYASRHRYTSVLPVHLGTKKAVNFRTGHTTIAQVLRKAGYATSVTGKWQLAALEHHPQHCREAGFDSWCVWQIWKDGAKTTRYWQPCLNQDGQIREDITDRYGPDVLADYVRSRMKTAVDNGQPFYIHHNMMLPHWPIKKTPEDRAKNREASLPHMIHYMDRLCGELIAAVDELGIAEDTWIIFMGDNGTEAFGEPRRTTDGLVRGGKRDLTDAGCHIPLLVRRAGVTEPGTCDDLVDMADWFPTLCDLTGTPIPKQIPLDGISFARRLTGGIPSERTYVTAGYKNKQSIFDGVLRVTTGDRPAPDNERQRKLLQLLKALPRR